MIPKEILQKVRHIEIRTKGLVNDLFGGEYHSVFKGRGMTFSEVREYSPGDDIRMIDWNVTARSNAPFIKILEEERELTVYLLVDVSRSGHFGTVTQFKSELMAEIAAVLWFSAIKNKCALICVAASGGARMQEGLISLMQMAKTSAALTKFSSYKLPFISILSDPTMGGVSASFAMLGDIIIAEPKALIGFAGPRVIESTVREKLPEGFQRAEFLLEHGVIDMIVDRRQIRKSLAELITHLNPN